MSLNAYAAKFSEPDLVAQVLVIEGTGASAPSKLYGLGMTVTRLGVGHYKVAFSDSQGAYVGHSYGLEAETPADMDDKKLVVDRNASSGSAVELHLYAEDGGGLANTAYELADNQFVTLVMYFKRSSISG